MGQTIYHGRSPSDPDWAESLNGRIAANGHTVFQVDVADPDDPMDYRTRNLYDLPGRVTERRQEYIAGSLTSNVGAAEKFHQSLSELGAIFAIDRSQLPQRVVDIQYDYEWATDHPGTYARVDSMDEFEIFMGDRLVGAGYFQTGSEDPIVNKWGEEKMRERLGNFAYADEEELACWGCDAIDFRDALLGTMTLAHTNRAVGGSIRAALAELRGYVMGFAGGSQTGVNDLSNEQLAREFQEAFVAQETWANDVVGTDHWVVLYEESDAIRDATERVPRDEFLLATNGTATIRDYGKIPGWMR